MTKGQLKDDGVSTIHVVWYTAMVFHIYTIRYLSSHVHSRF